MATGTIQDTIVRTVEWKCETKQVTATSTTVKVDFTQNLIDSAIIFASIQDIDSNLGGVAVGIQAYHTQTLHSQTHNGSLTYNIGWSSYGYPTVTVSGGDVVVGHRFKISVLYPNWSWNSSTLL